MQIVSILGAKKITVVQYVDKNLTSKVVKRSLAKSLTLVKLHKLKEFIN